MGELFLKDIKAGVPNPLSIFNNIFKVPNPAPGDRLSCKVQLQL